MGSVGVQLEQLHHQVNILPAYKGHSTEVRNPLIVNKEITDEILSIRDKLQSKNKLPEAEVMSVYLDKVYTVQPYLDRNKLAEYIDKDIHELAEGIMYQGNVLITDGNHRITLAKLNNQEMARMKIINLDKKRRK